MYVDQNYQKNNVLRWRIALKNKNVEACWQEFNTFLQKILRFLRLHKIK